MWRVGLACWLLLLLGPLASTASAAFPGGNGLLAVQPYTGPGLVLVSANGTGQQLLCADGTACAESGGAPRWSPDGRALALYSGTVKLIYADGSCLDCSISAGQNPAFTATPSLVSSVSGGRIVFDGIDGLFKGSFLTRGVTDAVWSGQARLAVVRNADVWAGRIGHIHKLGRGSAPSWSPLGVRIAFAHRGWVMVARLGHKPRRLVRGGAPAWSPDGNSIAFIDRRHDLRVIGASGGHARRVGNFRARAVDWQPVPRTAPPGCVAPPGSTVIANSPGAVVTSDTAVGALQIPGTPASAYLGCLTADGRERLLEGFGVGDVDGEYGVSTAVVAGDYAALINTFTDQHYGGSTDTVAVFDLRTGATVPGRGGETVLCPGYEYTCSAQMNQLVLGGDGVSAVHVEAFGQELCPPAMSLCTVEQILASDSTGLRTLDSITSPANVTASALTGLSLAGDTLTWEHSGTPESAQLSSGP